MGLFLDISGFTPLTERLGRSGAEGAEEMGRILAARFEAFVDTVSRHGGVIVDFAGDALMAVWRVRPEAAPEDVASASLACAWALQRELEQARLRARDTGELDADLSIKVALGWGSISVFHLGDPDGAYCVAAGDALAEATGAAAAVLAWVCEKP